MLPVEGQQRIMDCIPDRIAIPYFGETVELILRDETEDNSEPGMNRLFWGYVGDEPNYPVVVLSPNPTGIIYEQNRTLDTLLQSEVVDESVGTLKEIHGEPMYDEFSVIFAMEQNDVTESAFETGYDGPISPKKVAKQVAGELYAHFASVDLNYQAGDFEWPLRIELLSGPQNITRTAMGEAAMIESDTERWQFSFRVYYTMSWEVIVQSANRLGIDVSLDVDGDGTPDSSATYEIDLSSN